MKILKAATALACVALTAAAPPPKITLSPPRPDEQIGDWTVTQLENGSTIASVGNSGGSRFGVICDEKDCFAFLNPKITCEDGAKYPALMNSPSAAFAVSMVCEKIRDMHLYSMPLEGGVADAMSVGGMIGVAFPMASGQFQVARFSLTGAARASARASQLAKGSEPVNRQNASDNFSL